MKTSLITRIKNYYKRHAGEWIHKAVIEDLAKKATYIKKGRVCNYLGDNSTRRLRDLASDGILETDPTREGYYRYKGTVVKPPSIQIMKLDDGTMKAVMGK